MWSYRIDWILLDVPFIMLKVYFCDSDPILKGMIATHLKLGVHVAALAIKPRLRRMGARCLSWIWDENITSQLSGNKTPFI